MTINYLFAVINTAWSVEVPDVYVMSGNAAILRCAVPPHVADRIDATEWLTDEGISIFNYKYLGK